MPDPLRQSRFHFLRSVFVNRSRGGVAQGATLARQQAAPITMDHGAHGFRPFHDRVRAEITRRSCQRGTRSCSGKEGSLRLQGAMLSVAILPSRTVNW